MVPTVRVAHCVVWVSELAACRSLGPATAGRMAARPLLKNGEANISTALSRYSSQGSGWRTVTRKASATTARTRSLAIISRRRSRRSSSTPAMGPAATAGMARESITPLTTSPDPPACITRLSTATLLK